MEYAIIVSQFVRKHKNTRRLHLINVFMRYLGKVWWAYQDICNNY